MESLNFDALPSSSTTKLLDTKEYAQDEEEEILIEPRFKYGRLLGDMSKVLELDGASCIAVHDRFVALGCRSGRVCLFDHLGNAHMESTARHHKCAVSFISIDAPGNYFASCANDFSVTLFGIGCDEYNQRIALRVSARSICIADDFSRYGSGQKFAIGERDLVVYERSFLGRRKSSTLYHGLDKDGYITAISWRGPYIAFTNESGTRIHDCKISRTITLIQPLHKVEMYYSSKFQPRHIWLNSTMLAIGWANTVCICEIVTQKSDKGSSFKKGELIHRWIVPDFYIGGLSFTPNTNESNEMNGFEQNGNSNSSACFEISCKEQKSTDANWREIAIFGIRVSNRDESLEKGLMDGNRSCLSDGSTTTTVTTAMLNLTENQQSCAQLILLQPLNVDEYQLTAEETIEMRHAEPKNLGRFWLAGLPMDSLYFLLGAKELIEAHPCSVDDRIVWMIENELYFEAIDCALKNRDALKDTSVMDVGRHLIRHLMTIGQYDTAAKYLPQICLRQKEEWEYYVGEFEKARQILKLVPVIPVNDPQLEPECYESILTVALYSMPSLFLALILQWNADLYRVAFIRDKTIGRMAEKGNVTVGNSTLAISKEDIVNLYKVLAHLYVYERDFKRALEIYILLHDPSIFGVIERYNLFSSVQDRVVELMEINTDLTIRLLLDNENSLPSNSVVTSLSNDPKLQIAYLNKLFNRGEGSEHSDLMVRLYAEHYRLKLLPFLRKSENYRLDKALDVCRRKNLVEEKIFLLGRSGNRTEALEEIINNLGRIEMAIEFCKEHGETDLELWDRLIELAMKNPLHISALLSAIGTFIDNPLSVIEKIPINMHITGLKNSLLKILLDSEAQFNILHESYNIGVYDVNNLFREYAKPFVTFVNVAEDVCVVCGFRCFDNSKAIGGSFSLDDVNEYLLKIFYCGHKLHPKCLEDRISDVTLGSAESTDVCPLCFEQQAKQVIAKNEKRHRAATVATMGNGGKEKSLNPFYS